jgi:hypothetical protein
MSEDRLIRAENLRRYLRSRDWKVADLMREIGDSPRDTYWHDVLAGRKSFGEKAVRHLEEALRLPRGTFDIPPTEQGVAQSVSLYEVQPVPIKEWEQIVEEKTALPPLFKCAVPDDALAPRTSKGTMFTFDVRAQPYPGVVVLVQDNAGNRYLRRYVQAAAGQWVAAASEGYATLHSAQHGLTLLAVAVARWDGAG